MAPRDKAFYFSKKRCEIKEHGGRCTAGWPR
jgi:hypothetical protein